MNITTRFLKIAVLGGLLTLHGCRDYLDVAPQGDITEDQIRNDPAAAEALVLGAYNSLWDEGLHGNAFMAMTDIASDDGDKGSSPADGQNTFGLIDNLQPTANIGQFNSMWSASYRAIARANQAITRVPLSPAEEAERNRLLGEVRFLRAYYYFNLVRFFGGVPLVDRVPLPQEANNDEFQTRASAEAIYNFLIEDLEFALANVGDKGAVQTGRVTRGAAAGLRAKVALYRQDYQRAFDLTSAIIAGEYGSYGLLPNYEDIWREVGENSSESLFEVQTGTNTACNGAINLYVIFQGVRAGGARGWRDLGFGFNNPSESLVAAYEAGDVRPESTIIFINPPPQGTVLWDGFRIPSRDSVENDRYNYKVYHSRTAESNCGNPNRLPKNLRILRYGDILLIHAEAAFALDNTGAALNDINQLRERAGLEPLAVVTREAIWQERRVEMAMEHDRFFDIVRQEAVQPGRAVAAYAQQGKTFVVGKNELFPIPAQQIQLSDGRLTQNPGY